MAYMSIRPTTAQGGKTISIKSSSTNGKRIVSSRPSAVTPFFEDSFTGGQVNPSNGFTYSNDRGALTNCTVVAAATGEVEAGFTHSLRTRYGAQAIGLNASNGQINFSLGRSCNEIAIEWRVHIPSNYTHRNNYNPGPPVAPISDNNKFIHLWATSYSNGYHQPNLELNTNGATLDNPSDGKSYTRPVMRYSSGSKAGQLTDIPGGGTLLIGESAPMVPGTWNTVRFYAKKETVQGAADGIWKLWVNGTIIHNFTGLAMGASDPTKFADDINYGYLLGAANSGFTNQTDFHTQWIKFYDTNPGWE